MAGDGPALFTIPPGAGFLDALAAGLIARGEAGPEALILLPNRRACRALIEAFLRQTGGRAVILPRIAPLGEVEIDALEGSAEDDPALGLALDVPPAIGGLRRRLLLARLIGARGRATPAQAAGLADALARLADQVFTERLDFAGLAALVPDSYAAHWQLTLDFLAILTRHWPAILAEEGAIEPADRRNRLSAAQVARWRTDPPATPVIAAGSTGSVPATADLLAAIAALPHGAVVLPGLDRTLDRATRDGLGPSHPQYGMARLLDRIGVAAEEVTDWPAAAAPHATSAARARLASVALAPPEQPGDPAAVAAIAPAAVAGITRIDAPGPREEALAIALVMRQTLVADGRTAALVTPDRALARRVSAELRRWGIEIDDSAGVALGETPPGIFLRLVAEAAAADFTPLALLELLKHPLAALGLAPAALRATVREIELAGLRGPRPAHGIAGVRAALAGAATGRVATVLDRLEQASADFAHAIARPRVAAHELLALHVGLAEALAATDSEPGAALLWRGEAGDAAADFVNELSSALGGFPPLAGEHWPGLFGALMEGRVVRPRFGRHPRLFIWGLLEARMQRADRLILGGLNEGSWPADAGADPWMSRPMRAEFGLPAPERRVGLAAHDFVQCLCAPEVVLTRAIRVDGTPTVPSRWLQRLDNVVAAAGLDTIARAPLGGESDNWLGWQAALDRPQVVIGPIVAPRPCPPVALRPRKLSVTRIETWMRDPYAIYARYILNLKPLDPIEADPGAAERGTVMHAALEDFLRRFPTALPDDPLAELIEAGERAFAPFAKFPALLAFWWPRFQSVARWVAETERERRPLLAEVTSEDSGELVIAAPFGPFTLTAKADRIERLKSGGLAIVDYKTGQPPKPADIASGHSPQLALEAVIAAQGSFGALRQTAVEALTYWHLSGSGVGGKLHPVSNVADRIDEAADGLARLVAFFDDPATPYLSEPDPSHAPGFSDYRHLARVDEWSRGGGGEP